MGDGMNVDIGKLRQRLLSKIVKADSPLGPPCWMWTGAINAFGYGLINVNSESKLAHRMSYMTFIRPIPNEMNCLHHCDNRACINPIHLYLGTKQDNTNDMMRRGRHRPSEGEENSNAVISEMEAAEIKFLALEDHLTNVEIADAYGISPSIVSTIKRGDAWAHVEPKEPPPPELPLLRLWRRM